MLSNLSNRWCCRFPARGDRSAAWLTAQLLPLVMFMPSWGSRDLRRGRPCTAVVQLAPLPRLRLRLTTMFDDGGVNVAARPISICLDAARYDVSSFAIHPPPLRLAGFERAGRSRCNSCANVIRAWRCTRRTLLISCWLIFRRTFRLNVDIAFHCTIVIDGGNAFCSVAVLIGRDVRVCDVRCIVGRGLRRL